MHLTCHLHSLVTAGGKHRPVSPLLQCAEDGQPCATCREGREDCPGHFGFVKLALPVFHPGYFGHTQGVLQVVCKECSRVLLPEEDCERRLARVRSALTERQKDANWKTLREECSKRRECVHCGAYNGVVKRGPNGLEVVHRKYAVDRD